MAKAKKKSTASHTKQGAKDAPPKKITVFYAWQDTRSQATNRYAIRDALNLASSELSLEHSVDMTIDEATRDTAGSINIPLSIMAKIRDSDIFVCDITTIQEDQLSKKHKTPNPNVVFELGYAVAYLGWERIVMLFNKALGAVENSPFDFDRQRICTYLFDADPKNKKQNANALKNLCRVALAGIHSKNPAKEYELRNLSPGEIKRRADIDNLRWVLSQIHWPNVSEHTLQAPKIVSGAVLFHWEEFNAVVNNPLFHLYDVKLLKLLAALHKVWGETHSYEHHYIERQNGRQYIFQLRGDVFETLDQKSDWNKIDAARRKMGAVIPKILSYIRTNYLEISINETNKAAFDAFRKHLREVEELLLKDAQA